MSPRIQLLMALMMVAVLGCGQTKAPAKTAAVNRTQAAVYINALTASPSSISFSSTDPDLGAVSGSAAASVTFGLLLGTATNTWTVSVSAATSTFTGGTCTTIPASAITVTCASVAVNNYGGTAGTGACAASSTLSTTGKTAASGGEGNFYDTFTITLNLTLTDSWAYIAATTTTCPLSITYSLNAP
jgi:hypothetical protein